MFVTSSVATLSNFYLGSSLLKALRENLAHLLSNSHNHYLLALLVCAIIGSLKLLE